MSLTQLSYLLASDAWADVDGSVLLQMLSITALVMGLAVAGSYLYKAFWPGVKEKMIPQPLHVRKADDLATKPEMRNMKKRIEVDIHEIREQLSKERKEIREQITQDRQEARAAQEKIHERIDKGVQQTSETNGMVGQISKNVDKLLSLALGQSKN